MAPFLVQQTVSPLLFIAVQLLFARGMIKPVILFLQTHRIQGLNYRRESIPLGLGLFLWLQSLFCFFLLEICDKWQVPLPVWIHPQDRASVSPAACLLMLSVVFIAGWMDDTLGDKHTKGLRGHAMRLIRDGVVTTGLLKALAGIWMAAWAALLIAPGGLRFFLAAALVASTMNVLNLLDTRPGRAQKGFLAGIFLWLTAASSAAGFAYLFPLVCGVIFALKPDLQAKAMLGDMGSNLLGFALGLAVAESTPLVFQSVWLAVALILHVFAERWSFTEVIEHSPLLLWLDRLGRTKHRGRD